MQLNRRVRYNNTDVNFADYDADALNGFGPAQQLPAIGDAASTPKPKKVDTPKTPIPRSTKGSDSDAEGLFFRFDGTWGNHLTF